MARAALAKIGIKVKGIHEYDNAGEAVKSAEGVFVGGGNIFVLVDKLYEQSLLEILKNSIEKGTPYLKTSARSNICSTSVQTTNDMSIVYPPSYITL